VAGTEEGRCKDDDAMEDRAGAARSRGGSGVPAIGVQKGDGKVAKKLLRVDVVLMVSSVRAKRGRSVGTTARPSASGGEDRRRSVLCGVNAKG
jgi:hypothetical protein